MSMAMLTANPERVGLEVVAAALEPPPAVDYLAWAEANVSFDEGQFPGPYNRAAFPFWDELLRALGPEDPCRFVTLMTSAQIGKTSLAGIFALGALTVSRGTVLVVHPTTDNAVRWSKMKLAPLMRSTVVVREHFPQRANDSMASVLYKERKDGLARLLITGANSPASLSQVTVDVQIQDDLAKFENNNAGDPEAMADSRSRAIADAKIFKISTPLIEPGCRISRNFRDGSQELPYVPCPHCGTMQVLEWDNFIAALDPAEPDDAHFTCVACGAVIEEYHRPQMLAGFEWRAQNPTAARDHRSFWIWSAYSYLQSWSQIAREWLKAKGDPASEKTFWNDALGRAYETRGDGRPWEELRDRAAKSDYARCTVPKGALLLFLGIDCQQDRIEWQLVGCGEQYRRYVVDCGTIGKHISEPDCQRNLDQLLARTWTNTFNREMSISLTAIDAGFAADDVLAYCRHHSTFKVIAVRGIAGDAAPRIARVQRERDEKRGTVLRYSRRFYNVGANTLKWSLYKDLAKDDPTAPGYISFPTGLPDSYFQELVSEQRVAHKRLGVTVWRWEKPERQPNEMLDTMIYATAAALKHGVNWISDLGWKKLREEIETYPPIDDKPSPKRTSLVSRLAR
jgi:phage terminase large subunit GpA-like protein